MYGMTSEQKASQLINWGYRRISNTHQMVSRIDRPDWFMYMATKHAPWDPTGEGVQWAAGLGMYAKDYYRRCLSKDKLELPHHIFTLIPASGSSDAGYKPKKEDKIMARKDVIVDPYDVQGRYKVHGMNTVTGAAVGSANNKFYDTFDEALSRAKGIVTRQPDVQIVILKCTHVVQSMCSPVEVIDLDNMEHSDT